MVNFNVNVTYASATRPPTLARSPAMLRSLRSRCRCAHKGGVDQDSIYVCRPWRKRHDGSNKNGGAKTARPHQGRQGSPTRKLGAVSRQMPHVRPRKWPDLEMLSLHGLMRGCLPEVASAKAMLRGKGAGDGARACCWGGPHAPGVRPPAHEREKKTGASNAYITL